MAANNNNGRTKRIDGNATAKSNVAEPEIVVPLYKRLGAELIGTFALVFAAAPALIIMAMIYSLDKISGAYFNPAISLGFAITKHLKLKDLPLYIIYSHKTERWLYRSYSAIAERQMVSVICIGNCINFFSNAS